MNVDAIEELIRAAKQGREAVAGCFRVIHYGGYIDELETEFTRIGIEKGFGVRLQNAIAKAELELEKLRPGSMRPDEK